MVDFKRSSFRGAAWQGSLNRVFIGPFLLNRIWALQNTQQVQHENMGPEECGRSCLLRGKDDCNAIRYDRWEISAYIRGEIRTLPLQVRNDYKSQEIKHDWLTKKMFWIYGIGPSVLLIIILVIIFLIYFWIWWLENLYVSSFNVDFNPFNRKTKKCVTGIALR